MAQINPLEKSYGSIIEDERIKRQWEALSAAERSHFESEAGALYDRYKIEFEAINS